MTMPKGKILSLIIDSRYVLTASPGGDGRPGRAALELILPASMKDRIGKLAVGADRTQFQISYAFKPNKFAGETAADAPFLAGCSTTSNFNFGRELLEGWHNALLAERDRGRCSPRRASHEPVVYAAVTDLNYRRRLLDAAFPEG
jgi:hypothetical protein